MTMRLWDSLDAREHEYQYNPQMSVPDFKSFQARREQPNASARARLRCAADIAYGSHPLHGVDVYPAANAGAPWLRGRGNGTRSSKAMRWSSISASDSMYRRFAL
jgi:arylformamidase